MLDTFLDEIYFINQAKILNFMLNFTLLYLDPGSGSLLFQALISGFLTILIFFKRIIAFFKFKFIKKENKEGNVD